MAELVSVEGDPSHPLEGICGKMYDSSKIGDHLKTLQYYDELLALAQEIAPEDEAGKAFARAAWAKILMASQAHLQDDEHAQEILADYEELLNMGEPCSYLRGVLVTGERPAVSVQRYESSKIGPLDSEAVRGCLEHFKTASRTDITELIAILDVLGVVMEPALNERLQRFYVLRMKDEDPEIVLEEMKVDGLRPTTAHPYNMIFGRANTSCKSYMQYYEEMLELGIRPEPSTLRLLLKKNDLSKEAQANLRWQQKNLTQPRLALDMIQKFSELCGTRTTGTLNIDNAYKMFQRFRTEVQSLPTHIFNIMIEGFRNEPERAEEVYQLMLQDGVKPNINTYSKLIRIWHQNRLADSMDKWVNEMQRQSVEMDATSAATILDAYVRSNQRGRALQLLVNMLTKEQTVNNQNMYNIIMKFGPFDFAVGILGCLLSEGLPVSPSAKSTLSNLARDPLSAQFVEELNNCRWDAVTILRCDTIMVSQPEQHPSIVDCMRLLMREIKLSADDIEKRTAMLQKQVVLACGN